MSGHRIHVLFLSPWYPHRYDPMYGLFVERHAKAAALLHTVTAIYVHADPQAAEKWETVTEQEGNYRAIRVYYRKPSTGIRVLDALLGRFRLFKGHALAIRQMEALPDIVHVNILTRVGLVALYLYRKFNIPYIITEHWSRYQPGNPYHGALRKWLTGMVVKNAAVVTTVTRNLASAMQSHRLHHHDYRVIYNTVDSNVFHPIAEPPARPVKKIIHISCFEEKSKNLSGILHTIAALSKERSDFYLEMAGEGEDRQAAEDLAKKLGIHGTFVRFPGLLEGEAIGAALRESDFLLVFSHYENLPVVINEAFMSGVPVVSSDVGGIREILTPERGMLVPAGDTEQLKSALHKMLDHREMFDRKMLRADAQQYFSNEATSRYLDALYTGVLENPGRK